MNTTQSCSQSSPTRRNTGPLSWLSFLFVALLFFANLGCDGAPTNPDGGSGDCGGVCQANEECVQGQFCLAKCAASEIRCGSKCIDAKTSTDHCGKCDNACKTGESCQEGTCKTGASCGTDETDCSGTCANLKTDTANCGTCGTACATGESCQEGVCKTGAACATGETDCNGTCVNLKTSASNCGTCGNACGTDLVCEDGACKCQGTATNCNGTCVDTQSSDTNCGACGNACASPQYCDVGKCVCPTGQTACGSECVDIKSDDKNCGACETICASGESCFEGACKSKCPTGQTECEGTCTDTQTDDKNCGACGTACQTGESCQSGTCGVPCTSGQTSCGGSCVDTQTDTQNCGACGTACQTGEVCEVGVCKQGCPAGQTSCSGTCTNLQNDKANCGACGTACSSGEFCSKGACGNACASDETECNGTCIRIQVDPQNCGACGTTCATGEFCSQGVCGSACASGETDCGGACVNTQTDTANCGTCGTSCSGGKECNSGSCACPSGTSECNGACLDLQSDIANCGTCGTACTNGQICKSGACEAPCPTGQTQCSGVCVDTNSSATHCGACGTACTGTQVCTNGVCGVSCSSGQTACSGACVDLKTNTANCGACGTSCRADQNCSNSACSCPSGMTECSGSCVDLQRSRNNCGVCGTACTGTQVCIAGVCQGTWTSVLNGDASTQVTSIAANNKGYVYATGTSPRSDGQPHLSLKKVDNLGTNTDISVISASAVAFHADLNAEKSITNTNWNTLTNWRTSGLSGLFNKGSAFNNSTGEFTAPFDGYYHFSAGIRFDDANAAGTTTQAMFALNGTDETRNGTIAQKLGVESFETLHPEGILYLKSGQKITLRVRSDKDSSYKVQTESGFSGVYLGPTLSHGFHAHVAAAQSMASGQNTTVKGWESSNATGMFSNGGGFNASTGEFKAPLDGVYYFSARPTFSKANKRVDSPIPFPINNATITTMISINGSTNSTGPYASISSQSSELLTLGVGGFVRLKKNDVVTLKAYSNANAGWQIGVATGMSGYFVSEVGNSQNNHSTGFNSRLSQRISITSTGWTKLQGFNSSYTSESNYRVSLDSQDDFNHTTGEFTAPITGYYQFNANVKLNSAVATDGYIRAVFVINGSTNVNLGTQSMTKGPATSAHTLYVSSLLYVSKGQKVSLYAYSHKDNAYVIDENSRFSGYLVAPTAASFSGVAVATDNSDNLYVTGTIQGRFELAQAATVATPYTFLAKRKTDGTWEWQKLISRESPTSLAIDSSGNTILCGNIDGNLATKFVSGTTFGSKEAYAIKYNSSGAQQWVRILYSQDTASKSPKCAISDTGELYIVGSFTKKLNITGTTTALTNTSGNYRFLAKLASSNGNTSWIKQYNTTTTILDIAANQDGGKQAYLLGTFDKNGALGTTTLTSTNKELFVASIKSDGSVEWTQQSKINSNVIRPGKIGFYKARIYVTGDFNGSVEFGSKALTTSGGYDFFLAGLDTTGNWLWANAVDGSLDESGASIAFDNAGNYYLGGTFKSSSLTFGLLVSNKKASGTNTDGIITKTSPNPLHAPSHASLRNSPTKTSFMPYFFDPRPHSSIQETFRNKPFANLKDRLSSFKNHQAQRFLMLALSTPFLYTFQLIHIHTQSLFMQRGRA
ncbi:MAG: hypothetical protein H6728_01640 [Myxococcales bacterium]|nr:hypothetical protein [Myxococcales bacterium]